MGSAPPLPLARIPVLPEVSIPPVEGNWGVSSECPGTIG